MYQVSFFSDLSENIVTRVHTVATNVTLKMVETYLCSKRASS